MKGFYFVRHGQSVANQAGVSCGGDDDADLTEYGLQQARDVARRLGALDRKPCCILVSPLKRTLETARIISESLALEIRVEESLRERSLGDWNGQLSSITNPMLRSGITPPNGESGEVFARRVLDFFHGRSDCFQDRPLIVGSRGTGRILLEEYGRKDFPHMLNGELYDFELAPDFDFRIKSVVLVTPDRMPEPILAEDKLCPDPTGIR